MRVLLLKEEEASKKCFSSSSSFKTSVARLLEEAIVWRG